MSIVFVNGGAIAPPAPPAPTLNEALESLQRSERLLLQRRDVLRATAAQRDVEIARLAAEIRTGRSGAATESFRSLVGRRKVFMRMAQQFEDTATVFETQAATLANASITRSAMRSIAGVTTISASSSPTPNSLEQTAAIRRAMQRAQCAQDELHDALQLNDISVAEGDADVVASLDAVLETLRLPDVPDQDPREAEADDEEETRRVKRSVAALEKQARREQRDTTASASSPGRMAELLRVPSAKSEQRRALLS